MKSIRMKTKSISISQIVLVIFIILSMRGSANTIEVYGRFICFFAWAFLAFCENKTAFKRAASSKSFLFAIVYILWRTPLSLANCNSAISVIGYSISLICFFSGTLIIPYYAYRNINFKFLFYSCSAIYVLFCIIGIDFYIKNPEAARNFAEYRSDVAVGGGYGLGFGVAIISVYLFGLYLMRTEKKHLWKVNICLLLTLIAGIFLCYLIRSTIVLIAILAGLVIQLILYAINNRSITKRLVFMTIVLFALLMCVLFWKNIALWFTTLKNIEKNAFTIRMEIIGNYLLYGQESIAITGRINVYMDSIRSFFSSPIVGRIINTKYEDLHTIGNHSTILDSFAWFGIIGGLTNYLAYYNQLKSMKYMKKTHMSGVFVTWFLIALLDPITEATAACMILIMLGILDLYMGQKANASTNNIALSNTIKSNNKKLFVN